MTHDYHEGLHGYSPAQVLHDGCGECEARAAREDHGLSTLDTGGFARAWNRAAEWNRNGLVDISYAEVPLLSTLWSVRFQLERLGFAAVAS